MQMMVQMGFRNEVVVVRVVWGVVVKDGMASRKSIKVFCINRRHKMESTYVQYESARAASKA
jgi:hypothetical protein